MLPPVGCHVRFRVFKKKTVKKSEVLSDQDGDKWSPSRAGHFSSRKQRRNPMNWRLGGPKKGSGRFGESCRCRESKNWYRQPCSLFIIRLPAKTLIFLPSFVRSLVLNTNRHLCIPQSVQTGSGAYPVGTGIFSSAGGCTWPLTPSSYKVNNRALLCVCVRDALSDNFASSVQRRATG